MKILSSSTTMPTIAVFFAPPFRRMNSPKRNSGAQRKTPMMNWNDVMTWLVTVAMALYWTSIIATGAVTFVGIMTMHG